VMLITLTQSWVRRKRWEHKSLANELAKVLGGQSQGTPAKGKVSANQFLKMAGVQIQ